MANQNPYRFLAPREGSNYKQFFVTGRNLRAETLYRQTVGLEPRTLRDVAADYDLPVEAVQEAIQYCIDNADLLRREREEDLADLRRRGLDQSAAKA